MRSATPIVGNIHLNPLLGGGGAGAGRGGEASPLPNVGANRLIGFADVASLLVVCRWPVCTAVLRRYLQQ